MTSAVIQKNSYYDRTSSGGTGGVLSILKEENSYAKEYAGSIGVWIAMSSLSK